MLQGMSYTLAKQQTGSFFKTKKKKKKFETNLIAHKGCLPLSEGATTNFRQRILLLASPLSPILLNTQLKGTNKS